MNQNRYDKNRSWKQGNLTAVLVDYENLYDLLIERLQEGSHPDEFIVEMMEELHRYLQGKDLFQIAISKAFADFSALQGEGLFIQQTLASKGLVPRFVSSKHDKQASTLQVCIDALSLLYTREEIDSFVLISGNRLPINLVQHLKSHGKNVLVVALEPPAEADRSQLLGPDTLLHAADLLSEGALKQLSEISRADTSGRNGNYGRRFSRTSFTTQREATYHEITDSVAYETLRVIEDYFGQYDEVYLTPLLRKLSESLDDQNNDPKSVINKLEDAGAVWLEKRRGFPYDYTVLLVDPEHPDVQQIREEQERRGPTSYSDEYSSSDRYDEDHLEFEEEEAFSDSNAFRASSGDSPIESADLDSEENPD